MEKRVLHPEDAQPLEQVLGYLNFSAGAPDPKLLANLNRLWEPLFSQGGDQPVWRVVGQMLRDGLQSLAGQSAAFQDCHQAAAVLGLIWDRVLPGYLEFHGDLLFHQNEETLLGPFFVGRVCEAVLRQGPPWDESERITEGAIAHLNDYLGCRPIAVLESKKLEPYSHERLRPVPLFVRGAGVAVGPYREVVERALSLLEKTDDDLLQSACFDPALLDELAFDPRAYDFDHPANKRPNYHFGQWDPHHLDNQGRYRRFVVQQVTLDALMQRIEEAGGVPRDELLLEAAAVLAGTILMASGVSGSGPDTHDSTTTLATLLPRIAAYRDASYQRWIERVPGVHATRLREEAIQRRQPFGGARQHLNAQLARRRASQLERVQLAKIFARMGYPEAAAEQAGVVPAASARMLCQIDCRLTAADQAIGARQAESAAQLLAEIMEIVHRGIRCGALVDPWNILGFDAQFSLFPAPENSVHDHRVDELIVLMEEVFHLYSRVWSEAAARDNKQLCQRISADFRQPATWWRQFAAHEVSNVEAIDALDAYHAAEHVARALNLWHKGGAATGDIGFWASHAAIFDSPQAYALVIEALLDQSDYVATRGLLIHWLSQAERIPLEQGDSSFHRLAQRWLVEVRCRGGDVPTRPDGTAAENATISAATWKRIRNFFDYLEANAEQFGQVPSFELGASAPSGSDRRERYSGEVAEQEDDEDLFSAAYENVVYQDSADDGVEGELFDTGQASDDELLREADRLAERLAFLSTLARLWRIAALSPVGSPDAPANDEEASVQADRVTAMRRWIEQAASNRQRLLALLDAVHSYRIPAPLGDHDSMLEYDRRRVVKESLLERIVSTCVETADAARLLLAAASIAGKEAAGQISLDQLGSLWRASDEERLMIETFAATLSGDLAEIRRRSLSLMKVLARKRLLYVPLAKGGNPRDIVTVRVRQRCIQDLLRCLPRRGLLVETCRLIETAREMERNNPVGAGAVTEFDELFKIGYKSLVQCLVHAAESWTDNAGDDRGAEKVNALLVTCLERLTEALLASWLAHSRTLRLSVLEKVSDKRAWKKLVEFVERYGHDLFTQKFLNLGNLRAILHQGVGAWLKRLQEEGQGAMEFRLLHEFDRHISGGEAVERLTLVLEAIVENYGEYRDYNSTTTQSDRGELLHMLLDFLRLRVKYDRVCWNLKPVVLAHKILVRSGRKRAAQLWRRALRERINEEAEKYETRLAALQKKYAMQMPSIADRIGERFVRPMVIDRLCALVGAAVAEAKRPGPRPTFRMLKYETEFLTREPSGVGFDIPAWLVALEDEVHRVCQPAHERDDYDELEAAVPPARLPADEIQRQLDAWSSQ